MGQNLEANHLGTNLNHIGVSLAKSEVVEHRCGVRSPNRKGKTKGRISSMPSIHNELRAAGEPGRCGPSSPCAQTALLDEPSTGKDKLILDLFWNFNSFENNGT